MDLHFSSAGSHGHKTESAGTRINVFVSGMKNLYAHVTRLIYTTAGTLHTITLMKKVSTTTLSAAAAAGQAVVALTADPGTSDTGTIAAGDYLGIKKPDGSWHFAEVLSVSSLNITLTANVPTGGFSSGAKVVYFGAATDTPHDKYRFRIQASQTNYQLPDDEKGLLGSSKSFDEPLVLSSSNETNAGRFEAVEWGYSRVSGVREST